MSSIVCVQFGKDTLQVVLNGVLRDVEVGSDDLVRTPTCDSTEYVEFARSNRVVGSVLSDLLRDFRGNSFVAVVNESNRLHQFLSEQILQKVTDRPCLKGSNSLDIARGSRQDDDPRLRKFCANG